MRWPYRDGDFIGQKWKRLKLVVSDHYPKSYLSIHFKLRVQAYRFSLNKWFNFGLRWPNFGRKWLAMAGISGFRQISRKRIAKFSSNSACKLNGWDYRIDFILGRVRRLSSFLLLISILVWKIPLYWYTFCTIDESSVFRTVLGQVRCFSVEFHYLVLVTDITLSVLSHHTIAGKFVPMTIPFKLWI